PMWSIHGGREAIRGTMTTHDDPPGSGPGTIDVEPVLVGVRAALAPLVRAGDRSSADIDAATRQLTEAAANAVGVARASVWRYDAERHVLVCVDLFSRIDGTHTQGTEIDLTATPRYIAALSRGGAVAAHDAQNDPRTSEFTGTYLAPLHITAMLDASVLVDGALEGIICHEHVGDAPRAWSALEVQAALLFADLAAVLSRARRSP
ncbi:MAG: GAF domain-containing protein, partial [Myxococcales bacterium]|nr:GAF domain-containing protein [Myxococcales bacterium]